MGLAQKGMRALIKYDVWGPGTALWGQEPEGFVKALCRDRGVTLTLKILMPIIYIHMVLLGTKLLTKLIPFLHGLHSRNWGGRNTELIKTQPYCTSEENNRAGQRRGVWRQRGLH